MTHAADPMPLTLRPEDVDVDDREAMAAFLERTAERMWGPQRGPAHPILPRGWRERRWCRSCGMRPGTCAQGLCAHCVDARVLDGLRGIGQPDRRVVAPLMLVPRPPRRPIDTGELAALYSYRDPREEDESMGGALASAAWLILIFIVAFLVIVALPLHALGGH